MGGENSLEGDTEGSRENEGDPFEKKKKKPELVQQGPTFNHRGGVRLTGWEEVITNFSKEGVGGGKNDEHVSRSVKRSIRGGGKSLSRNQANFL